ncbi:MAG TPA: hypothetical protein DCE41_00585, partial [Cytophagales bacterium]|nr:hypothetical protein [Cytophagales bacterium]
MNEMNTLDASKSPLWHPWLPNTSPDQWLTVVEGEGCWVKDEYGNRYLDACGGVWSTQCGLGNKPIIEAITEQLHTLSFASLMQNRTHPTALKLAKKLVELTPDPLENVFLTNSGSESVDLAIKLARQFWQIQDRPDKHHIVHLDCSFHGSFFGSMSVTGLIGTPPGWSPGVPSMHAIPAPLDAGVPTEEALWQSTQQLEMLAIQSFGNLAAFIVEPIVGSAG